MGKDDAAASQRTPEEVVGGEQTGGVHGIAERDVDKDALHDHKNRRTIDYDSNCWDNPVDGAAGCPGEDEEANGWAEGADEGREEAVFLRRHARADNARVLVEVEPGHVCSHTQDAGHKDAEEDKTDFAHVHAVVNGVHEGEDLEDWGGCVCKRAVSYISLAYKKERERKRRSLTGVVDAIDDGCVDLHEEHGRIFEGNLHGLDKRINGHGRELHVSLVNLALRHETRVARKLAEALGPTQEDVRRARLREQAEHEDGDGC